MSNKNKARYLIIDCNNFFASCEKIFRPDLRNKPVVVLSSNDGCVISMSKEAKQLNIKRSDPYFKIKDILEQYNIAVFSSNFRLYSDISSRIMNTIKSYFPNVEVYSIDEAFVYEPNFNIVDAIKLKNRILKYTDIPVSIGIGETKTLAKIAVLFAKKIPKLNNIFDISSQPNIDQLLSMIDIKDIWGIGRNSAEKLYKKNVKTAKDLKYLNPTIARKILALPGEKIVSELNGIPCIETEIKAHKKSLRYSKSFGIPVKNKEHLLEAISTYAEIISKKLREQNLLAHTIIVEIRSHPYDNEGNIYKNFQIFSFSSATNATIELIKASEKLIDSMFIDGLRYKKVGITAINLIPDNPAPQSLFENNKKKSKLENLDKAIDSLKNKYGETIVSYAGSGINKIWDSKKEFKSPEYTTNWGEIPIVKA